MSVEDLIETNRKAVVFLREKAAQISIDMPQDAREMRLVAMALERAAAYALAADEILHSAKQPVVDHILAELQHPLFFPSRETSRWSLHLNKRADSIFLHLRHDIEIVSPAETITAVDRWRSDLKKGPG